MTPKFYTTKRDGKIALWVSMPYGGDRNIWDITSKSWNKEVESAVISAFYLGVQYHAMLVNGCGVDGEYGSGFDKEEK